VQLFPSNDGFFNLTIKTRMGFVFEFERYYRCMLTQTIEKEIIKLVHLLIHSHWKVHNVPRNIVTKRLSVISLETTSNYRGR